MLQNTSEIKPQIDPATAANTTRLSVVPGTLIVNVTAHKHQQLLARRGRGLTFAFTPPYPHMSLHPGIGLCLLVQGREFDSHTVDAYGADADGSADGRDAGVLAWALVGSRCCFDYNDPSGG